MDQADCVNLGLCVAGESKLLDHCALVTSASAADQVRGRRPRSVQVTPVAPGSARASRWTPGQ